MEADDLSSNEFFINLQRQRNIWDIVCGVVPPPDVFLASNSRKKIRSGQAKVAVSIDASLGFLVCVPHALSLRDAVTPSLLRSHILCTTTKVGLPNSGAADKDTFDGDGRRISTSSAPNTTRDRLDLDRGLLGDTEERENLGVFTTLNGKSVKIAGSEISTGDGFKEARTVRILYTEELLSSRTSAWDGDGDAAAGSTSGCASTPATRTSIASADGMDTISIVHIDRPFEGGIDVPFGGAHDLDATQISRFICLLRAFPENELMFSALGDFFRNVNEVGAQWEKNQSRNPARQHPMGRLKDSIDAHVRSRIKATVQSLRKQDYLRYISSASQFKHHLLQLEQVMESFVLSNIHDPLFAYLVQVHKEEDELLHRSLERLTYCTHKHLGTRPEFQVPVDQAVRELLRLASCKTALQKLLCLKNVFTEINASVEFNLYSHYLDIGNFQLTADDLVDQLIYVLVQAHRSGMRHLHAHVAFIRRFHFRNVNTTVLGYNLANLEVAIEWIVRRVVAGDGNDSTVVPQQMMCMRAVASKFYPVNP